ncbi:MAG TPA: PssD/Cps14F family polysaccharide biosynthesis glycosyltransferase [Terriglobales bacterium]|nr:PssD/Cps14F family polysaccharide biosynthesis glycosyltransferase [Terriglobales bacterium]
MKSRKKICIVSSCGGHLTEIRTLQPYYEKYQYFYVLNDRVLLPPDMQGRTYFVTLFERDWNFFVNLWEARSILRKERPDVILSSGAGVLVPFALLAKIYGIPVVFVENMSRVTAPSLTAKIMYRLADRFFYQWEPLGHIFPRGECSGPLI